MACSLFGFPLFHVAGEFVQQDKIAIAKGEQQHIDIGRYGNNEIQIHLSTKKPLYDNHNQIIGTIFTCLPLHTNILHTLFNNLLIANQGPGFYTIGGLYDQFKLSKRESECLFFIIRGMTAKDVAQKLHLSPKTVEFHIEQIKQKLSCSKKSELIEKAINLGFIFNIPSKLLHF